MAYPSPTAVVLAALCLSFLQGSPWKPRVASPTCTAVYFIRRVVCISARRKVVVRTERIGRLLAVSCVWTTSVRCVCVCVCDVACGTPVMQFVCLSVCLSDSFVLHAKLPAAPAERSLHSQSQYGCKFTLRDEHPECWLGQVRTACNNYSRSIEQLVNHLFTRFTWKGGRYSRGSPGKVAVKPPSVCVCVSVRVKHFWLVLLKYVCINCTVFLELL